MGTIWKVLTRKKVIDPVTAEESQLARRLNTFDLTALGVGSTLGVGVYVLAGHVAKSVAGPSVVLSFFIAAVASVFAGLCYAEFGARVPRAGSAYIYSYVCVGEFVAFIIGWNLILEYIIGSASVAKGLSLYLDPLINNTLQTTFREIAPIDIPFMAKYFDFLSFGISLLLAIALAFGLKESSLANNIFTTLNIGVVLFVVVAGSLKADIANWNYVPDNSTNSTIVGKGGFFPFGLEGTITGAATCFYGFVGFDCIATTGEEAKNPKKAIPVSIILSLSIIFLAYFGISTVVTLMVPYYLQDPNAPIPYAFEHIGWNWAKWIVSIGGIFGLCASLFGAMFPLPRIIYAMANDSLVFKFLGRVSSRFQTPVIGTLIAGTLTGLMAALFELNQLVNMMSIGTLMAYTIVAASVLLLRYTPDHMATFSVNNGSINDESELLSYEENSSSVIGQIFNCGRISEPTKTSQSIVAVEIFLYSITCLLIGLGAIYLKHPLANGNIWALVLVSCIVFVAAILLMSIATQPTSRKELNFKVPLVPLIPALSILVNIYLMLMLDFHTWIRFAVWMAIGLPTYYFSLKPIDVPPRKLSPEHKIIDNHSEKPNSLVNYQSNNGYIEDHNETEPKTRKKKAPSPPTIEEKTEVIEIQQELEKFDEMLDQVANTLEKNRKTSVGSVSMSDVSREENVIADVHCDNVLTPAIPSYAIIYPKTENIESSQMQTKSFQFGDDIGEATHNVNNQYQKVVPPSNLDLKQNTNTSILKQKFSKRAGSIDSPVPPDTPVSFISVSESDQELTEASPFNLSPSPTPPPSANTSPLPMYKLDKDVPRTPNTPPPPPLPQNIPLADNTQLSKNTNTRQTLPRVTSNNIKEVTLRPTRKRAEDNTEKQFEPDDDNLKIGSDKAKSFIEDLNNKLKFNLVSTYLVPTKKGPAQQPPEHLKNENVIEDSINKDDAKEKLGLFVNSRISVLENNSNEVKSSLVSTPNEDNLVNQDNTNFVSQSNEKNDVLGEDANAFIETPKETEEGAYLAHQDRMKNVFRSMKNLDVSKEQPTSPSRNVKTLDHKPADEAQHRQAMNDIFESIQLRRKESASQHSAV